MKKVYKLENLDCASCAAKMEEAINKLDGVNKCTIGFMTQKITLNMDDDKVDEVLKNADNIISTIEKDCYMVR